MESLSVSRQIQPHESDSLWSRTVQAVVRQHVLHARTGMRRRGSFSANLNTPQRSEGENGWRDLNRKILLATSFAAKRVVDTRSQKRCNFSRPVRSFFAAFVYEITKRAPQR
jgi:hypothetical protein